MFYLFINNYVFIDLLLLLLLYKHVHYHFNQYITTHHEEKFWTEWVNVVTHGQERLKKTYLLRD